MSHHLLGMWFQFCRYIQFYGSHVTLQHINFIVIAWFRAACDNNELHDAEVDSARTAAEKDVTKTSNEIIQQIDREFSFLPMIVPLVKDIS